MHSRDDFKRAANLILDRVTIQPKIGMVLGSGLGKLAEELYARAVIPYADIPGWAASNVHGHAGNLVIGGLVGQVVAVMQGRPHFYEGYSMQQITFPIRVMKEMGIDTVILTNAAGGINPAYEVGDIMLLEDHINLPGMTGASPLMGPNDESLGLRFVGMAQAYDRDLRRRAMAVAKANEVPMHSGVYFALSGPAFETPAEIRMLRILGADAVGMSTAHEVLVARHGGMRVLAFSGITNQVIDQVDTDRETDHLEVLEAGEIIVPRLTTVLKGVLSDYPA